ncbi:hypothetical protein MHBO_002574 [Bonamia ostreae]|uniref:P-type ATPase C-terminal domain-containing protein n=1 Tax=Bonamia ostreae TaxID=126728 RepID=A0ABV2AMS5_9EUKA
MAADFALSEFQMLQKLLLVHGSWSYRRATKLVLNYLHKNFVLSANYFLYTLQSGWSGTFFANSITMSLFNSVFTAYPLLFASVIDQCYSAKMAIREPILYRDGPNNKNLNFWLFLRIVLSAVLETVVITTTTCFFLGLSSSPFSNGQSVDSAIIEDANITIIFYMLTIRMAMETDTWIFINFTLFLVSIIVFNVWMFVYSIVTPEVKYKGNALRLFSMLEFWISLFFCVIICNGCELLFRYFCRYSKKTVVGYKIIQELEKVWKKVLKN